METSPILHNEGCIEFLYGPMFAEKGLEMARRAIQAAVALKQEPIWFKPADDTYSPFIESRIGLKLPAISLSHDIPRACEQLHEAFDRGHVIGADEVQFLCGSNKSRRTNDKMAHLLLETLLRGMRGGAQVFLSGLDNDYRNETFPFSEVLLRDARVIRTQMMAICSACRQRRATLTQRLLHGEPAPRDMPTVVVKTDGPSPVTYEPRCAAHYRAPT